MRNILGVITPNTNVCKALYTNLTFQSGVIIEKEECVADGFRWVTRSVPFSALFLLHLLLLDFFFIRLFITAV